MIPNAQAEKFLIVTFLADSADEETYSYKFPLKAFLEDAAVPANGDIISYGGSYWHVIQVVHEWGQHQHNLCLTVTRLQQGGRPPYPVALKSSQCKE
jgi:hypothetical protein